MTRYAIPVLTLVFLTATANAEPAEKLPGGAKIVKLDAQPQRLELKTPFEYGQLLITGHLATGEQIDVTRWSRSSAGEARQGQRHRCGAASGRWTRAFSISVCWVSP